VNRIEIPIASLFGLHLPPTVALLLTVAFVIFLFRRDIQERPNVTGALWLPLLWMLIACSRTVSQWLDLFGVHLGGVSEEEGSPLDACIYFALIVAGICLLNTRQVNLAEFSRNNAWLVAFLLYCFIAILWSDFPFIAFKRWIKILGPPIMVLILLTEPDPGEALRRLMKRCAYVIVPVSILLIKYYPEIGRRAIVWGTEMGNTGIASGKNLMGADCLILGFFFFWHLLQTWRAERSKARRDELLLIGGFLVMLGWIITMVDSSTSLGALLIGLLTMVLLNLRFVNKRLIGTYILLAAVTLALAELAFGISGYVIELLGRDSTLTGRTDLWKQLLGIGTNPILGVGFESFWLGPWIEQLREGRSWVPNEAHNGYLETYLNLGLVGLVVLIGLITAVFRKICSELLSNFEWGRFRMGFLAAVVFYNWTESSFRGLHPMWFVFYIIALDYPRLEYQFLAPPSEAASPEEEKELAYFPDEFGMGSSPSRFAGGARDV
jgi:exopolysaccharide production protein ExoQ